MTLQEMRDLKPGDRVEWVDGHDPALGTVTERERCFATITWDDGSQPLLINTASWNDRLRTRFKLRLVPMEGTG